MKEQVQSGCLQLIHDLSMKEWTKESYDQFVTCLKEESEPSYGDFSSNLLPGVARERIIGIRLPMLRKIAGMIARGEQRSFLHVAKQLARKRTLTIEELLIRGMVIGKVKDWGEAKEEIEDFIPWIDNWSVNDSFCASLKIANRNTKEMFSFIQVLAESKKTYEARFAYVMMLDYFVGREEYIDSVLAICNREYEEDYYVQMAVAWTISMCYVKYPQKTIDFFYDCKLDRFTYNKAIQKIIESKQVTAEQKDFLRSMRRK